MYAPPQPTSYVWVPHGAQPPPPVPTAPLHPMAYAVPTVPPPPPSPAAPAGWVFVPGPPGGAAQGAPVAQPMPPAGTVPFPQPMLAPPGAMPFAPPTGAASTIPHGYPPTPIAVPAPMPMPAGMGQPPVPHGQQGPPEVPKAFAIDLTMTTPDCDKVWLDAETGAVNVRVLLLKSRDIRRKLRAALYHAGRPQYRLSANERAKASRCSEYAALLRVIDATARECGMLPCTEEMTLAHADALSVLLRRGSADSTSSTDKPSGEPREEPQPASWSLEGMRDVFLVTPGAAGLGSADEHFAAAHELYYRTHGAGAVTDRAEIFAVLYRKFVIAAAAHIVALRNHRN